ncbi:hypothetical protein ULF88_15970 [Halopseudomonas pachastrellae]|nr:hypothetical protein [Halopseudomonas pachastrellae]
MRELVPSYGQSLVNDGALLKQVRERTLSTLNCAEAAPKAPE